MKGLPWVRISKLSCIISFLTIHWNGLADKFRSFTLTESNFLVLLQRN